MVFVSLRRTQGCQSVQATNDANASRSLLRHFIYYLNRQGNKPPIGGLGDPRAGHLPFEAKVLRHIHPSQFGYPDAMIPKLELIIGKVETSLASLLAFERGTTCPFPAF